MLKTVHFFFAGGILTNVSEAREGEVFFSQRLYAGSVNDVMDAFLPFNELTENGGSFSK